MDKDNLLTTIDSIEEKDLVFLIHGKEAGSRFNYDSESGQRLQDNIETVVAYTLYSMLLNSVFLKAKGTQACNDALPSIRKFAESYVQIDDPKNAYTVKEREETFCKTVSDFILSRCKRSMPEIFENMFPLVILRFSSEDREIDKKTYQYLIKNKEIIFNQAVLFSRSIYRSLLMSPNIDSFKIKTDLLSFDSAYFTYDNYLVLPIYDDAFSLNSLKEAIRKAVSSMSERLDISCCNELIIAYLLIDFLVKINL